MGWSITKTEKGWEWGCFFSAYGAAGGVVATEAEAKVRLVIAQSDILEHPLPPAVVDVMLSDPERFAADYPDAE